MFGSRFFGSRFFARRFFGKGSSAPTGPTTAGTFFAHSFFGGRFFGKRYFGAATPDTTPITPVNPYPVVSLFARAIGAAAVTADGVMGEAFEYRPMASGPNVNARAIVDVTRAIVPFVAIYGEPFARAASGPVRTPGVDPQRQGHAAHASDRPFISLRLTLLPYAPRTGDQVMRVATGQVFSVAEILRDGFNLARLDLNKLRS